MTFAIRTTVTRQLLCGGPSCPALIQRSAQSTAALSNNANWPQLGKASATHYETTKKCFPTRASFATGASCMDAMGYNKHSHNQYDVHTGTRDMLRNALLRANAAKRNQEETLASGGNLQAAHESGTLRIADLGSADGSNSMTTLQFMASVLQTNATAPPPPSIHVTFEEHPDSDEAKLRAVLESQKEWFSQNDASYDIRMKSFYEPLFPPESIDFVMGYICVHWLDTTDVGPDGIVGWKSGRFSDGETDSQVLSTSLQRQNFITACERTAPSPLRDAWRRHLADRHLAKFLALRAQELRPGGEMILVMAAAKHEWNRPPPLLSRNTNKSDDGPSSPLTKAMAQCVADGTLRASVLESMVAPHYLRTLDDVRSALSLAQAEPSLQSAAKDLEFVELRQFATKVGGDRDDGSVVEDGFELYWSIHFGAFKAAGASEEEIMNVKSKALEVYRTAYDWNRGVQGDFIACVLRKRTA